MLCVRWVWPARSWTKTFSLRCSLIKHSADVMWPSCYGLFCYFLGKRKAWLSILPQLLPCTMVEKMILRDGQAVSGKSWFTCRSSLAHLHFYYTWVDMDKKKISVMGILLWINWTIKCLKLHCQCLHIPHNILPWNHLIEKKRSNGKETMLLRINNKVGSLAMTIDTQGRLAVCSCEIRFISRFNFDTIRFVMLRDKLWNYDAIRSGVASIAPLEGVLMLQ